MSTVRLERADTGQQTTAPARALPKVTTPAVRSTSHGPRRKFKPFRILATMIAIGVTVVVILRLRTDSSVADTDLVYHTVQRTDLDITVTERGNLASQIDVKVLCEVDDIPGDNINGTPILWIVDNGASVEQGDLIVELDPSSIQDRLDKQILEVEEERLERRQAEVEFENRKTQNETDLSEAQLAVELTKLAVQQFGDKEAGTFQIDLQAIELEVQQAEAERMIEQTNLAGVETLYKLGYRSSGELAQARLNSLRAERQLANAISKRRELVEYEFKKMKMELEGASASAKRNFTQTILDNEAKLAQAKARLMSSQEQLAKEEELLERYLTQIANCKIYAPQDGMVAYYTGGSRYRREEIRAGAEIRPRQPILTLPNLTKMQVKTAVHESVLDQIKTGQRATIRVDAFPDMRHVGLIASVAVLPDQGGWLSSDTKVYQTVVTINGDVEQLKPGMTAVVEIHAAHLSEIIAVPVQAIVQIEDETWCYVQEDGRATRRTISLGLTNSKYVEIRDGLQAGDRVVLNPSALPDSGRKSTSPRSGEESATRESESKMTQELS